MVLETVSMKLLGNPVVLQMMGLSLLVGATLVIGFLTVRGMRKNMMEEMSPITEKPRSDGPNFALATYQGVIATLKDRETQLKSRLSSESSRAEMLEAVSNRVLENIPTGVVMFSQNLM